MRLPVTHIRLFDDEPTPVRLIYVNDRQEGITRKKKGKGFCFFLEGKPLQDKRELQRIKKLAIPPSWTEVWICTHHHGHLQATGYDLKKRKQYRYHPAWNAFRNETKFHRMLDFGRALPALRAKVEKDMKLSQLNEDKVIATVISLMERTSIRVGNNSYEKLYGSYGLTTLKDKHVEVQGSHIRLSFRGKKGIKHNISLKNKKLASIVKQCRDIPGKDLFQYYDEQGNHKSIDSGMVNAYIKDAVGSDFSAKDLRTWSGTVNMLSALRSAGYGDEAAQKDKKKCINEALGLVSKQLGNTVSICRKYYVHPQLIQLYENGEISAFLDRLDEDDHPHDAPGLHTHEKVLMDILASFNGEKRKAV